MRKFYIIQRETIGDRCIQYWNKTKWVEESMNNLSLDEIRRIGYGDGFRDAQSFGKWRYYEPHLVGEKLETYSWAYAAGFSEGLN